MQLDIYKLGVLYLESVFFFFFFFRGPLLVQEMLYFDCLLKPFSECLQTCLQLFEVFKQNLIH